MLEGLSARIRFSRAVPDAEENNNPKRNYVDVGQVTLARAAVCG
jgi:hypothetical protein